MTRVYKTYQFRLVGGALGGPILGSQAQITLGNIALGKSRSGFVERRDGTGN